MRIRVDFTLEIQPEKLPALRELASADNNNDALYFVKAEAEDYVRDYLSSNGVPNRTIRRDGYDVG